MPIEYVHTCKKCGYEVFTSGVWKFYRDDHDSIQPYGHIYPVSDEAEESGIHGLIVCLYCPTCDATHQVVLVEFKVPFREHGVRWRENWLEPDEDTEKPVYLSLYDHLWVGSKGELQEPGRFYVMGCRSKRSVLECPGLEDQIGKFRRGIRSAPAYLHCAVCGQTHNAWMGLIGSAAVPDNHGWLVFCEPKDEYAQPRVLTCPECGDPNLLFGPGLRGERGLTEAVDECDCPRCGRGKLAGKVTRGF